MHVRLTVYRHSHPSWGNTRPPQTMVGRYGVTTYQVSHLYDYEVTDIHTNSHPTPWEGESKRGVSWSIYGNETTPDRGLPGESIWTEGGGGDPASTPSWRGITVPLHLPNITLLHTRNIPLSPIVHIVIAILHKIQNKWIKHRTTYE